MSDPTNVVVRSYQRELRDANPSSLPDVLRKVHLSHQLATVWAWFQGLSAATTFDITRAASKTAATTDTSNPIAGITLADGENLPAIGKVVTLRVTTGTANQAPYIVTDAAGSAIAPTGGSSPSAPGVALLSNDGKSLTFSANVTAFLLEYIPRAAVTLTDSYLGT